MEAPLLILLLLVVVAALVLWRRRQRTAGRLTSRPAPPSAPHQGITPLPGRRATITIDVVAHDPENPAVQRLVRDAAFHVLRSSPNVDVVIVEDREGTPLGMIERDLGLPEPPPAAQEVPKSDRRPSQPSAGSGREQGRAGRVDEKVAAARRSFADRFEFPDVVRALLGRPDDPVDIVRAILEAGGLPVQVHDNLLLTGDEAMIVVSEAARSTSETLTDAFLRFQKSGASHGVVITLGSFGPRDIERRQALAPSLRYTGMSAIQRMADAVALGGDPLRFATRPAVLR